MIYICENILDFDLENALSLVSDERREKALRYRFENDRRQSIAAYLLLKYGLKEEYSLDINPEFESGPCSKPSISGHSDIHFNISHCRKGVACAISSKPIGIDIEEIAPIDQEVARYVMSRKQLDEIYSSSDPERAFCTLWTTKESLLKQTGEGICANLPQLDTDAFRFVRHHGKNYVCTACYSSEGQHEDFRFIAL